MATSRGSLAGQLTAPEAWRCPFSSMASARIDVDKVPELHWFPFALAAEGPCV